MLRDYQQRFKFILVDEYQDTNVAQYLWLRLLAQPAAGRIAWPASRLFRKISRARRRNRRRGRATTRWRIRRRRPGHDRFHRPEHSDARSADDTPGNQPIEESAVAAGSDLIACEPRGLTEEHLLRR